MSEAVDNGVRNYSLAEFEDLFDSVKNWGRWGPDDTRGTLNYIRPEHVRRATSLVRTGQSISLSIPVNKTAGPGQPQSRHPLHGDWPRQRHRFGQPALCHRFHRHAVSRRQPHSYRRADVISPTGACSTMGGQPHR